MARPASLALGGFYATPEHLLPAIAALVAPSCAGTAYLDPCAGEGVALQAIVDAHRASHPEGFLAERFAIEMEESRYQALRATFGSDVYGYSGPTNVLHADAFKVDWTRDTDGGVGVLLLNPPYDTDSTFKRLEERFLDRFAPSLMTGGALLFLVPFYALAASARTLARCFDRLACWRFPEGDFEAFKQVVLVGRKRAVDLDEPDAALVARVMGWSASVDGMPVLGASPASALAVPANDSYRHALAPWKVEPLDLKALLARARPWSSTDRAGKSTPIAGIVPDGPLEELLARTYPLAVPPRAAHIAAGIAAGVFNGARVTPDDPRSHLPAILVKGVFDKEFRTVETKRNKDGDATGEVQVQQPKLVTTALDLSSGHFVTIRASVEKTDAKTLDGMTMSDLLTHYGRGLMDVMLRQCPVMHDPKRPDHGLTLPTFARPLYHAQKHATIALVKLLGGLKASRASRRGKAAFLLGEIGSGKSATALAVADTISARRTLVMCPPHLLTSWADQARAVVPHFRVVVLSDVGDVAELAASTSAAPTLAILSRETAKLGHAYAGLAVCGDCGAPAGDAKENARKRLHCEATRSEPTSRLGRHVEALALALAPHYAGDARLPIRGRAVQTAMATWTRRAPTPRERDRIGGHIAGVVRAIAARSTTGETTSSALKELLLAHGEDWLMRDVAVKLFRTADGAAVGRMHRDLAREVLLMHRDGGELDALVEDLKEVDTDREYYDPWNTWGMERRGIAGHNDCQHFAHGCKRDENGVFLSKEGKRAGDLEGALDAVLRLHRVTTTRTPACGAALYQAIPSPRRYPLATYIAKRHPRLFDMFILDEAHEAASDGAAQERAAHRLTSLGIPSLLLTGSVMNGYASSLFTNLWAVSPAFRREFARDEQTKFVTRYGYRKRLVTFGSEKDKGKVVEYGAVSDRVQREERTIGDAPGVLPLLVLRHLLPLAVTMHKADMAVDVPPCTEVSEYVQPTAPLMSRYEAMKSALMRQIKRDRFTEDNGKLWGALAELPAYLDLASEDVGNRPDGSFVLAYPDAAGGEVVASSPGLPAGLLLPKEAWLLAHLESAFAEGRNVLVFVWHTRLMPRLARLIREHLGVEAAILESGKVPTAKRETWINERVVSRGVRVLLTNPVCVKTGLNNLVHFADEVWMENPCCSPEIYRQAVGRVDRIGQKKPTRILFPIYAGTAQEPMHKLLLHKVAVSLSTDGLDGESALQAAGVDVDTGFSGFDVGRQLYEMLRGEDS